MKASLIFMKILVFLVFASSAAQYRDKKPIITYITGLWDINRGSMRSQYSRSYEYYLKYFAQLLQTQSNLIIYGDNHLHQFVRQHRSKNNTVFIQRELEWFKHQWYTPMVQKIIDHLNSTDHKKFMEYEIFPQYGLKMYNPVVMSKLYLMTQALSYDIFQSDYFLWVDGGFTHAHDKKFIIPADNTLQRLPLYFQGPFIFQTFDWNQLEHGFTNEGERYVKKKVVDFVWANYIGGRTEAISTTLSIYQNFKRITFENYDMWTDQSIFSLMLIRFPYFLVAVNNITVQKFQTFRFHTPKYHTTEQIRHFEFSKIHEYFNFFQQKLISEKIILIKTIQTQELVRERIQYSFKKNSYEEKLSLMRQEAIILVGLNFFFFIIYRLIKREMNRVDNNEQSQFEI